ncbi:MAG TPA: CvpA family protein [Bauldia sp.]|nr:CvpA family protein [Bauldia sp.]
MPVTILDLIVIVVVLVSAVLAMVRGFVREVLSVASWVAAVAAAYFLYKPLVPLIRNYIPSATIATIVAAAVIFFIALIVASYITTKISDFVIDSRVGALDRALGFVFGAARGLLLLVIALLFFSWLVEKPPSWVANARSEPLLADLGERLKAALPDDVEEALMKRFRHDNGDTNGGDTDSAPADSGAAAAPPDTTYGADTRQNLNTLIQNSDN